MTALESSSCANCTRAITGAEQKFCPACGQPTPAHRIDWHFLGHELEHSVLHMDRGIFYSLRELMLRPGHFMRNYLQGRRVNQVKPLPLLLISAATVLLLGKFLLDGDLFGQSMQAGLSRSGTNGASDPAVMAKLFTAVKDWMNAHLTAFTLLLLPLEAAAFWLAFRGRGLNYPEWLVVSSFLTVQAFVFMAIAVLLQRWLPSAQAWVTLFACTYTFFSLLQLFKDHSRWTTALRAALGLGMFMLAQTLFAMALVFILFMMSAMR